MPSHYVGKGIAGFCEFHDAPKLVILTGITILWDTLREMSDKPSPSPEGKSVKFGLSPRITLATVVTLLIVVGLMVVIVEARIARDVEATQSEAFRRQSESMADILYLQLALVRRTVQAHVLNDQYREALRTGEAGRSNRLLGTIYANIGILEDVLLVNADGEIVASAEETRPPLALRDHPVVDSIQRGEISYMDEMAVPSPVSGAAVLHIGFPIIAEGNAVGGIVAIVDVTRFAGVYITSKRIGESGYAAIIDENGIVVAHPKEELVFEDMSRQEFFLKITEAVESASSSEIVTFEFEGAEKVLVFQQVRSVPWYVVVTMDRDEFLGVARDFKRFFVIYAAGAVLLLWLLLVFMMRRLIISRLLRTVQKIDIAARGDLTVRSDLRGTDELAYVGGRFNRLMDSLSQVIVDVVSSMKHLKKMGTTLESSVEHTVAAANQIDVSAESTQKQIENQVANVTETSAAVEEMTKNIESLNGSIEQQASSVTESASAVEEMVANIQSIDSVTSQAVEQVEALGQASQEGRGLVFRLNDLLQRVSDRSDSLSEANELIAGIASQTNLLAMNAAIEAAHAGAAGAGFAVVADEIRNLAEGASEQSKEVNTNLREVVEAIERVAAVSRDADSAFEKIQGSIEAVDDVFKEISAAMREQATGGQELLATLNQMKEITSSVSSGSEEMTQGNQQILAAITSLNNITSEIHRAVEEISRGSGEISTAMEQIASLSGENSKSIADVLSRVAYFSVAGSEAEFGVTTVDRSVEEEPPEV